MVINNKVCLQWARYENVKVDGALYNLPTSFTTRGISVGNDCGVGIHQVATAVYSKTQVKIWCKPGGSSVVTIVIVVGY